MFCNYTRPTAQFKRRGQGRDAWLTRLQRVSLEERAWPVLLGFRAVASPDGSGTGRWFGYPHHREPVLVEARGAGFSFEHGGSAWEYPTQSDTPG